MGSCFSRIPLKQRSRDPSSENTEKMSSPAFSYHAKAQTSFQPPLIANGNAYLGDVVSRYIPIHIIHI